MRFIIALLMLCPLLVPSLSMATDQASKAAFQSTTSAHQSNINLLLDKALSQNLIAGGVVVVGNRDGIIATASRGQLNGAAGAPQLNEHTLFDIASLTKVVATAPAVMKLLDDGKIHVNDPISRWFPEFAQSGRGDITVQHLLTHTSGLDDVSVSSSQPMESTIRKAAAEKNRPRAGSRFHYADINFILLGELVHRVSGQRLDAFCQEQIYSPLGAQESMFLPPRELAASIAPTSGYAGGVVQDGNARKLGGVAGHAGLFASAYDLSRYARLLLGGGTLDNKRILSEQAVAQMTSAYDCNGSVRRGLGWDISSPFSAPKGNYFSNVSFGHTGYSGSSMWIDPQQNLFVIMLTRRLNYSDTRSFNQLRRDVSTVAAADFKGPGVELAKPFEVAKAVAKPEAKVVAAASSEIEVYLRDGVLVATNIPSVKEQHVERRVARVSRASSKACSVRRPSHVTRVAKADTKSGHSRKRRLAKS